MNRRIDQRRNALHWAWITGGKLARDARRAARAVAL